MTRGAVVQEFLGEVTRDMVGRWPPDSLLAQGLAGNATRWDDVLEVLRERGAWDIGAGRLREKLGRTPQWNEVVTHFMTEVEALAWATEVARLPMTSLVPEERGPDIVVGSWGWVEAKTINPSKKERGRWRDHPDGRWAGEPLMESSPTLYKKVGDALAKAKTQWSAVDESHQKELVLYLHVAQLDSELFEPPERIWDRMVDQARLTAEYRGIRFVLAHNFNWREPVRDVIL